jgi:hypothetical protein
VCQPAADITAASVRGAILVEHDLSRAVRLIPRKIQTQFLILQNSDNKHFTEGPRLMTSFAQALKSRA